MLGFIVGVALGTMLPYVQHANARLLTTAFLGGSLVAASLQLFARGKIVMGLGICLLGSSFLYAVAKSV